MLSKLLHRLLFERATRLYIRSFDDCSGEDEDGTSPPHLGRASVLKL